LKFFFSGQNWKFTSIDAFFARESRRLTRITFKIRFNDLTIHESEAIRLDSSNHAHFRRLQIRLDSW